MIFEIEHNVLRFTFRVGSSILTVHNFAQKRAPISPPPRGLCSLLAINGAGTACMCLSLLWARDPVNILSKQQLGSACFLAERRPLLPRLPSSQVFFCFVSIVLLGPKLSDSECAAQPNLQLVPALAPTSKSRFWADVDDTACNFWNAPVVARHLNEISAK